MLLINNVLAVFIIIFPFHCYGQSNADSNNKNANKKPPNIIYILADDLCYGELGAYGQEKIETPNIDRLANEGIIFRNAFVTNSICAPSRAVLLTGKHSHVNGQLTNAQQFDGSQLTFPKVLQQAG